MGLVPAPSNQTKSLSKLLVADALSGRRQDACQKANSLNYRDNPLQRRWLLCLISMAIFGSRSTSRVSVG